MSEPDFIAALDQKREEMKGVARLMGDYFAALLEQGFERGEAMDITRDYQAELFQNARDD